jgi:L-ascorbate metabolism protein UlaG (beta-lactamase superfamily)
MDIRKTDYNTQKALSIITNPKFDPNIRAEYFSDTEHSLFWHLAKHNWYLLEELLKRPDLVIPVDDVADHAGSNHIRKLLIKYKKVPKALKKLMM